MGFFKVANFIFFLISLGMSVLFTMGLYEEIKSDIILYGDIQFDFLFVYLAGMILFGIRFTKKYYKQLTYSDEDHEDMLRDKYSRSI